MPISVVSAVYDGAQFMAPSEAKLTGCTSVIFSVLHNVHRVWRYYRYKDLYANPDNLMLRIGGEGINFFANDNGMKGKILRVIAFWVSVMHKMSMCVDQYVNLHRACEKLSNACRGYYPKHEPCTWIKVSSSKGASPSTVIWISSTWRGFVNRVSRIFWNVINVFKEMFKLSMRIMDTIEVFSVNPEMQRENVKHIFINALEGIDSWVRNQEAMLGMIRKHKSTMQAIMNRVEVKAYNVDTLEGYLLNSLRVAQGAQTFVNAGGGFVGDLGKNIIFTVASFVGEVDRIPTSLLPAYDTPWKSAKDVGAPPRLYAWPMIEDIPTKIPLVS